MEREKARLERMKLIRSEYVGLRLYPHEKAKLLKKCEALGIKNISECIRTLLHL
jgi:hypothetical protein